MRYMYRIFIVPIILLMMVLSACSNAAVPEAISENASSSEAATDGDAAAEAPTEEPATETDSEAIEPLFADFDPANFTNSTNIDNEWSPLQPGMHWVYEGETVEDGESIPHRIEFTVTGLTKEIDGVRTVVAWVVDMSQGEIVESELSFYAQDDEGSVWYLGEYPEEYEGGEFVAAPTWISGIAEAKAGVKMVKEPQMDTPIYFQGWAPAIGWSDFGIVARMGEETCVPVDCYQDVLIIDESSLEEAGAFQQKFYARGVGNIHVQWSGEDASKETLDVVEFRQLDADALAEIHALAMEQEARAYERSPDVYGLTPPME